MGTGLSGELTEMECEFDVPRLMGTSFKQPKGRQLGPPQMWTRGSVGSAPRGQKQGRRVREGAACECSGSSQLRQEGTRGPLNHSGGRARAVKMPSVLPKGAEKNQPIWRKGLRTDGQGHRPSPWSVSCRPWCWEGWAWGVSLSSEKFPPCVFADTGGSGRCCRHPWVGKRGEGERERPAQAPARAHLFPPVLPPGKVEGPLLPVGFSGVNKAGRRASTGCLPPPGAWPCAQRGPRSPAGRVRTTSLPPPQPSFLPEQLRGQVDTEAATGYKIWPRSSSDRALGSGAGMCVLDSQEVLTGRKGGKCRRPLTSCVALAASVSSVKRAANPALTRECCADRPAMWRVLNC